MRRVSLTMLASALVAHALLSDEAVRSDGRVAQGTLHLEKAGKLLFTSAPPRETISPEQLAEVRFVTEVPIFRGSPGHLVHLPDGQRIAGEFLGLVKDQLLLRTVWAERLSVPRSAAVALTHLPG